MMLISSSEQIFFEDLGSVGLRVFQELEYEYWKTFYPMIIAESSFIFFYYSWGEPERELAGMWSRFSGFSSSMGRLFDVKLY